MKTTIKYHTKGKPEWPQTYETETRKAPTFLGASRIVCNRLKKNGWGTKPSEITVTEVESTKTRK